MPPQHIVVPSTHRPTVWAFFLFRPLAFLGVFQYGLLQLGHTRGFTVALRGTHS